MLTKTGELSDPNPGIRYLFRDRLGSVAAIGDTSGLLVEFRGYDPYGRPRNGNWTDRNPAELNSSITYRGFTDHEHLDDWQLIHMNGRGFDYNAGRFLSVDPFIQAPGNSQSINGFAYIMNNPLSGTDPTGYSPIPMSTGTRIKGATGSFSYSGSFEPSNPKDGGDDDNGWTNRSAWHDSQFFSSSGEGGVTDEILVGNKEERSQNQPNGYSSGPNWTWEAVIELYRSNEYGDEKIREILSSEIEVYSFEQGLMEVMMPDGSTNTIDVTDDFYGLHMGNGVILINANMSAEFAAVTLFHEWRHSQGVLPETEARYQAEEFAEAMGWPETGPGYRDTYYGGANRAAIIRHYRRKQRNNSLPGEPITSLQPIGRHLRYSNIDRSEIFPDLLELDDSK